MSYNGSGTFQINTSGQPVVAGTVISSTAFNALTADLATGLSTAITKDGQTATTARIPFAQGITSTLVTDSSSTSTGSIITAGGLGVAKAAYIGTTLNVASTTTLTGTASLAANLTFTGTGNRITGDFSNATIANRVMFQTSTASAASNISIIPNGTIGAGGGTANIRLEDSTSIATGNGSFGNVLMVQDTDFRIQSSRVGTGTYLPMAFYTGGSERVRIDTSGNVGIGTTSPKGKLTVLAPSSTTLGDEATSALNIIGNNGASKFWQIGFGAYDTSFTYAPAAIGYVQTTSSGYNNGALVFATRNVVTDTAPTEAMRIDSSGNVGIGTSSPATKLEVSSGSVTASNYLINVTAATFGKASDTSIEMRTSADATPLMLFRVNGNNERMRIDSSGNVGIGTSSPVSTSKLTVNGSISVNGADTNFGAGGQRAFIDYTTNVARIGAVSGGVATGTALAFTVGNAGGSGFEAARIDSVGNVGIGTTSPNASAILDAQSTTKGVRMPNMTTTQKNAISSPAAGLMVFDTTLAKLCVYSGAAWQTITSI